MSAEAAIGGVTVSGKGEDTGAEVGGFRSHATTRTAITIRQAPTNLTNALSHGYAVTSLPQLTDESMVGTPHVFVNWAQRSGDWVSHNVTPLCEVDVQSIGL